MRFHQAKSRLKATAFLSLLSVLLCLGYAQAADAAGGPLPLTNGVLGLMSETVAGAASDDSRPYPLVLDHSAGLVELDRSTALGQLDADEIAQGLLSMVRDAHRHGAVTVISDPFMTLGVLEVCGYGAHGATPHSRFKMGAGSDQRIAEEATRGL